MSINVTVQDGNGSVDVTVSGGVSRSSVSDDGTLVLGNPTDINFSSNLTVFDDGDGSVKVDAASGSGFPDAEDDGTVVVSGSTAFNFANNLTVTDDGDGTVSVDASGGGSLTTQDDGTNIETDTDTLDFQTDFNVTNPDAGQAEVALDSNSVTVAGNTVALGGSTTVSIDNLSDVASSTEAAGQLPIYHGTNSQYENADLSGGDGIGITTADASITLALQLATSAGLKFSSGNLAIEPTDFAGNGLVDNADNLAIATDGVAGNEINLTDIAGDNLTVDTTNDELDASTGASPGGSDTQIQYNNAGSFGGIAGFTFGGTNLTGVPAIDDTLALIDQAADPAANGEMQLNGTDVKVYSGGAVRNLSNIGGGVSSLSDLSDASVTSPAAGQSLLYHSTNSQFENAQITGGNALSATAGDASLSLAVDSNSIGSSELVNDSVTVAGNAVSLGGSTAVSINDLSDVSSSSEAAGQVPIWNETNTQYENSTLTGGDGISITNADASITLAAALATSGGLKISTGDIAIEPADFAGTLLSDDGSDNLQVNESNISHDGIDQATVSASDHHQEPSAGTGITDEATNQFGIATGGVTDTELGVDTFSFDPGMTNFESGLSDEEINRIVLQTGETLVIERIEFRQKGGGSSTSASIDVRDTTAATTVGSQNLGGTTKDPGSSGTANTVIIRLNNSTGNAIDVAPRVEGYITGA